MNARYYVPYLNRFLSADPIVPNPANPQSFNRYSYVLNNPLKYIDPSGHRACGASEDCSDFESIVDQSPLPTPIWERSPVEDPDRVQYYGFTVFSKEHSYNTNAGQHSGLDYSIYAQSFGGTWNAKTEQWEFDGTYGVTEEHPLIPVYVGCYYEVKSTSTGSPYAPGRENLTQTEYSDFLLIYGHLQDIQVISGPVEPVTIIGYLDTTERHAHLGIRRESDNYFVNPFNYLSPGLQAQMLSFHGDSSMTTYQSGRPTNPARQPIGYYR